MACIFLQRELFQRPDMQQEKSNSHTTIMEPLLRREAFCRGRWGWQARGGPVYRASEADRRECAVRLRWIQGATAECGRAEGWRRAWFAKGTSGGRGNQCGASLVEMFFLYLLVLVGVLLKLEGGRNSQQGGAIYSSCDNKSARPVQQCRA